MSQDLDATVNIAAKVEAAPILGTGAYGETDHLAQMQAMAPAQPWETGKASWGTPGTPLDPAVYEQMRQTGQYLPPSPIAAPITQSMAAPSASIYNSFDDARQVQADILADARNIYTQRGDYHLIGSSGFHADVQDAYRSAGLAPAAAEAVDPEIASPYASAARRKSGIEAMVRDDWTLRGDFAGIGSSGFKSDVQSEMVEAGLAEAPKGGFSGAWDRLREDKAGLAFGVGYSAMTAGSGVAAMARLDDGQYHTPEQNATAQFNAAVPAVAGIAGTVIGSALGGPAGGLAGQFVGGALGQAGSAIFGASQEREQATREAAEKLAAALGQAADSVGTFKTQIEATGAPVQQFAQSLGVAGSVGTYGPGTVAGVGALTNAFQERAGDDFAAIARYSSGPLLHDMGVRVGAGQTSAGDIVSMGFDAAEQGDFSGLKTLQQAARDAETKADPAFQNAARKFNSSSSLAQSDNWATKADLWVHDSLPAWLGGGTDDDVSRARDARVKMESRHKELAKPVESEIDAQNALINQFAEMKGAEIVAEGGISVASSGLTLAGLRGASAATLAQDSKSLYAGVEAARTQTASEIKLLQGDLADPARSAGRAPELQSRIAVAETRLAGYDVTEAQQKRSVMGAEFEETESRFGLTRAGEQEDLMSGLYGGKSFAQLRGDEDRIFSAEGARARQIRREALNPLLNPADRDKKLTQATGIESQERAERYQFAQNVYAEENAGLDITRSQRSGAIERAEYLGTPQDTYNANIANIQTDRDQIAQNNSEIGRGNLTNDQVLRLRKQNTDLQNEVTIAPERSRVAAYDAEEGILGDTRAADRSQLARNVSINGSSAYGPGVFADDRAEITHLRGAEDGSPVGSVQRARFRRERAGAETALLDDTTQSQLYRETSVERTQDNQIQGAYRRSQISPWMDGSPDGDPLTRRNAELGNLQNRLSGAQKALDGSTDPLAREQNSARVEDYKDQIAEIEHDKMFAIERLLPEMIAGAGGRGTLAGVLPTKGQAAYFNANPYVTGSWGPAPRPAGAAEGGDHPQVLGGTAGRFLAAHGGAPSDDPALALLARIANSLENLKPLGGRSPASLGGVSGGFNAQRPRNND